MKVLRLLLVGAVLTGCVITDDGIALNPPGPQVFVCLNAVTDDEAQEMKQDIADEPFKDDRLNEARRLAKDRCFQSRHVVTVMSAMQFESNKLEIAKFLYLKTEDQDNYNDVVDALTYSSSKEELRDYIDAMS
ncbi:MAG: hypothetical protein ACI865_001621 [Flavobacteriaceae bacterium]|jgi:hypothetical protein